MESGLKEKWVSRLDVEFITYPNLEFFAPRGNKCNKTREKEEKNKKINFISHSTKLKQKKNYRYFF